MGTLNFTNKAQVSCALHVWLWAGWSMVLMVDTPSCDCHVSSRSLSGMVARIKTILTDNQKKTDYKPEMIVVTNYTQVSFKIPSA